MACILSQEESDQVFLDLALEGFFLDFTLLGLSDANLSIHADGGTCKLCIFHALKINKLDFYHDLMKLSLETFQLGPDICKAC